MLAPVLLAAPSLLLYRVPNDIFIASAVCLGFYIAIVALRLVYMSAENPRMWHHEETARAAWSIPVLRVTAILALICALFLIGRVDISLTRWMFNPMSLNKGSWNIIRVMVSLVLPICAALINTNPVFRIFSAFAFPALGMMDLLSQVDIAGQIYCIDQVRRSTTTQRAFHHDLV